MVGWIQNIPFDYVITVCDNAKETCPFFPTNAVKLHHNFPDPSKHKGTDEEIKQEFAKVREMIKNIQKILYKNSSDVSK